MKKCQFQKGPTCQIFALKNAVELSLNKQSLKFGKKDRYKFKRLEQLVNDADKCQTLNRLEYFYSSKKKNDYENERLPTYVAIFARAFPKFKGLDGKYNIQFKYEIMQEHWSNYLQDMFSGTTFVLIVKNIMLGQSKGMLDPDGHEITFGTSANIYGWKKTFTALRAVTSPTGGHAVAIENIKLFGNQRFSRNVSKEELLWYYDLLQVSLLAEGLSKDDETRWKLEADSVFDVLCKKFNMSKNDPRFDSFLKNLNNEVLRTKMSLLNIMNDDEFYGYFEILDSNGIGAENKNCRWIIPFSQFDHVVDYMIIVEPLTKEESYNSPFVYDPEHYQLGSVNTVISTEKSIYKQDSDKLLTEQEIETILLEGYKEGYFYETGQEILVNDRVKVYGYDFVWRVVSFDDEDEILVNPVNQTKIINLYTNEEYLTFISREPDSDSDNDSETVSESKLKRQKIEYKLKY